jgi:hypothetical protein
MLLSIAEGNPVAKITAFHYITIPRQVYLDLCGIVDHYDTEVSGCGLVERIEHRFKASVVSDPDIVEIEFKIHEIFLPEKQTNTRSSTEISESEIFELQNRLLKENKNTELLRLHWHSHADMGTFHSGTDEENYATLSGGDFLVSLVLNKSHHFLGRVDYFKPVRVTLTNLDIKMILELRENVSPSILENIKKLDEYEKEQDSKVTVYTGGYGVADKDAKAKELTDDLEVARMLDIPIDKALKYRKCLKGDCEICPEVTVCHEYLYSIDKLSIYPGS